MVVRAGEPSVTPASRKSCARPTGRAGRPTNTEAWSGSTSAQRRELRRNQPPSPAPGALLPGGQREEHARALGVLGIAVALHHRLLREPGARGEDQEVRHRDGGEDRGGTGET